MARSPIPLDISDLNDLFAPPVEPIDPRDDKAKRTNEAHKIVAYLRDAVGVGGTACREAIASATGTDGGHVHVRVEHLVNVDGYNILGGKARWGRSRLPLCACHRTQQYSLLSSEPVPTPEQTIALKLREIDGVVTIDWDGPARVSSRYTQDERDRLDAILRAAVPYWRSKINK